MTSIFSRSFAPFVLIAILAAVFVLNDTMSAHASAPTGLQSLIATSSNPAVSTTPVIVFATSTCAARVITTGASPIMITFADIAQGAPSGLYGHLQAASTTVVYDGGQVGCGALRVYSFTSQVISVSEAR